MKVHNWLSVKKDHDDGNKVFGLKKNYLNTCQVHLTPTFERKSNESFLRVAYIN